MGNAARRKIFFLFVVLIMMWFGAAATGAANLSATPSLALSASWDSNIFSAETGEESDYIFRAAPRLSLLLEGPATTGELVGGIEGEKYADHDELDETAATKTVEFRVTRTGPRLTITPSARFVETNDFTRTAFLADGTTADPGPGLAPAETILAGRVRSQDLSGALRVAYLLSPTLTLEFGGTAGKREFGENTSGFAGSRTVTGDASLGYTMSARASAGVFLSTSYNSFDGAPNSRTYSGGVRGTYRATEHTTLSASAGATLLREHIGTGDDTDDDWFPTGSLSIAYAKQDFRATLLGSYTIAGGGAFGETTERATVSLTLSDRVAERWSWRLHGAFQNSRSTAEPAATAEDVNVTSGAAGVRYEATSWASVGLSGNIYRQRAETPVGQDVDREIVILDLTLRDTFRLL